MPARCGWPVNDRGRVATVEEACREIICICAAPVDLPHAETVSTSPSLSKQIVEILLRQILELRQDTGDDPRAVALAIALAAVEFRAAHDIQGDPDRGEQASGHSGPLVQRGQSVRAGVVDEDTCVRHRDLRHDRHRHFEERQIAEA